MLTPAVRASSTSEPPVIIANAVATQVAGPPFLYWLPLADATTAGLTVLGVITVGPWPNSLRGAAAAMPATAVVRTKSRRFSFFMTSSDLVLLRFHASANTLAAIIIRWASEVPW